MLQLGTALGLKPDIFKYKLQINFFCLLAKYYIWICRLKTFPPILNNVLGYMKHIYAMEKSPKLSNEINGSLLKVCTPCMLLILVLWEKFINFDFVVVFCHLCSSFFSWYCK